jgi:hypothetical protein
MNLIFNLAFFFIFTMNTSQFYLPFPVFSQNQKPKMLMESSHGINQPSLMILKALKEMKWNHKETLSIQEIIKKEKENEEEKRREIINQLLMPLTRGNSFMRDFYSGRY